MLLKQFFKESFFYGMANVLSRFLGVLLLPVYTNFLSPSDFSNLTILQALFSVLTFFLTLVAGVMFYFYKYKSTRIRLRLITTWFYYQCGVLVPLTLFILLFFSILEESFIVIPGNEVEVFYLVLMVLVQLLPYIFTNTALNSFRIARDAKKALIISVLEAVLSTLFSICVLVVWEGGIFEVLLAQTLGRSITVLFFFKSCISFTKWKNFSKSLLKKLLVYNWPYFFINILSWFIVSMDKFMGSRFLQNPLDIALLAVCMQLVTPIVLFSEMLRMALAPFIMALQEDQSKQIVTQKIFDYSMFLTAILCVLLVVSADLLLHLLTNDSYNRVLGILPLFCISQLFAVAINQVSIDFNLAMKNVHILLATFLGGLIGVLVNYFYMRDYGIFAVAFAQISAQVAVFLYLSGLGRNLLKSKLIYNHFTIFIVVFSGFVFTFNWVLFKNDYSISIESYILGFFVILVFMFYFLRTQEKLFAVLVSLFKSKFR